MVQLTDDERRIITVELMIIRISYDSTKPYCEYCGRCLNAKSSVSVWYDPSTGKKKTSEFIYRECPSWWCRYTHSGAL